MGDKQLSAIELEIEEARQRLGSTIDQLTYRASPKTIARREADNVKGFFVGADGSPRTGNIAKVAGGLVGVVALLARVRTLAK